MVDLPTDVPKQFVSGDSWAWEIELSDYSASDSWASTIYFENAHGTFSAAATVSGTTHSFSITAAITAGYKPGRYGWRLRVTDGSTVSTIRSGFSEVLVNPATSGTVDIRTDARKMLDAVNAFLIGNASTAQQSMSLGGRQISRWSLVELREWRKELQVEVRAEEAPSNGGKGRDIKLRFGRA